MKTLANLAGLDGKARDANPQLEPETVVPIKIGSIKVAMMPTMPKVYLAHDHVEVFD